MASLIALRVVAMAAKTLIARSILEHTSRFYWNALIYYLEVSSSRVIFCVTVEQSATFVQLQAAMIISAEYTTNIKGDADWYLCSITCWTVKSTTLPIDIKIHTAQNLQPTLPNAIEALIDSFVTGIIFFTKILKELPQETIVRLLLSYIMWSQMELRECQRGSIPTEHSGWSKVTELQILLVKFPTDSTELSRQTDWPFIVVVFDTGLLPVRRLANRLYPLKLRSTILQQSLAGGNTATCKSNNGQGCASSSVQNPLVQFLLISAHPTRLATCAHSTPEALQLVSVLGQIGDVSRHAFFQISYFVQYPECTIWVPQAQPIARPLKLYSNRRKFGYWHQEASFRLTMSTTAGFDQLPIRFIVAMEGVLSLPTAMKERSKSRAVREVWEQRLKRVFPRGTSAQCILV